MDYFDSGQLSDFSVRDVFESEVKSEIDELLSTETTQFARETVTNMDLGTGLPSSADMGLEITELQSWDQGYTHILNDGTLNGTDAGVTTVNNVNVLDFSPDKYGLDSSHNIFVDPQTGLPSSQPNQVTLGATHIRAQQVNLFVNSARDQQQALLQVQQGLGNISPNKVCYDQTNNYGLQQFNHVSNTNGLHQANAREFTHYQLQNGQGQTITSARKNGIHRISIHDSNSYIKAAKHQPYPTAKTHIKKAVSITKNIKMEPGLKCEKVYSKPCYSYSCLITMALKNSKAGCLPVSEIYYFMCENFPYFKTAKDGWKNSVRHNLSLNKCFAKVETAVSNAKTGKKGCLWAMNPEKAAKMEEEVHKSTKRDPNGIRMSMAKPEDFPKIEALSRLTHPKNLKNHAAAKMHQRQSSSTANKRLHSTPVTVISSNNSIRVKPPIVTIAARQPVPVSLKKVDLTSSLSQDLFNQEFNLLDPQLLSLDGDLGLQDEATYDMVEILPFEPVCTSTNPITNFTSSLLDTSPFKDHTQTVNSRLLGLDTSPITTLANTLYGLEQSKPLFI